MNKRNYSGLVAPSGVDEQSAPDPNPHHIAASNITPQQDAAHHAYFGGRIELLKQGYMENAVLHCYDIASAYPAGMVDLPSLGLVGGPAGL